jgi:hypothetical protein
MYIYLKCIDSGSYRLTIGKTYKAKLCADNKVFDYYIINDINYEHGVEGILFVNIQEVRISKLEELGI